VAPPKSQYVGSKYGIVKGSLKAQKWIKAPIGETPVAIKIAALYFLFCGALTTLENIEMNAAKQVIVVNMRYTFLINTF